MRVPATSPDEFFPEVLLNTFQGSLCCKWQSWNIAKGFTAMRTASLTTLFGVVCALIILASEFGTAAPPRPSVRNPAPTATRTKLDLPPAERAAVERGLELLRGCQLADGALVVSRLGTAPDTPVWIAPYFTNHGALALLAAADRKTSVTVPALDRLRANLAPPYVDPEPARRLADIASVGRWLEWQAAHQHADGYFPDYVGTIASYQESTQPIDAYDSSAAMYLLVLERFQRVGGTVSESMLVAARQTLACLRLVTDRDGLTWAKPDYQVKFLMDNVEVRAGLAAAQRLFLKVGSPDEAATAGRQAAQIAVGLQTCWEAVDPNVFAWALHPNGAYDSRFQQMYPDGLAQLFGISSIRPDRALFRRVRQKFPIEGSPLGVGAERFLVAATRLGGEEEADLRVKTVNELNKFTPRTVYIHRPALAVLALIDGADWLPTELPTPPTVAPPKSKKSARESRAER